MERVFAWVAVVMSLVLSWPASATDRYYADQHVISAGKVVRLNATSPDNAGERNRPFARDFTYTLTRVSDGTKLWSRKQGAMEGSPIRAFVHDDGWVVVWDSRHRLMVLEKDTGEVKAMASILDQFPQAESRKYVHQTTAGPMWAAASNWSFASLDGHTVFFITTGWGRRVVMDVVRGKFVHVANAGEKQLLESELEAARAVLRVAVENIEALCESGGVVAAQPVEPPVSAGAVTSALAVLLRAEDKTVMHDLRRLERCGYIGSSGGWSDINGKYKDNINPFQEREFTLRRIAQLGLRRLGEKPAELPGVQISDAEGIGAHLPEPRAERVELVQPGMVPREILESIGHPDLLRYGHRGTWEYDIDDDEPFTLVIHFDVDHLIVERTERVSPRWKEQRRWDDAFGL